MNDKDYRDKFDADDLDDQENGDEEDYPKPVEKKNNDRIKLNKSFSSLRDSKSFSSLRDDGIADPFDVVDPMEYAELFRHLSDVFVMADIQVKRARNNQEPLSDDELVLNGFRPEEVHSASRAKNLVIVGVEQQDRAALGLGVSLLVTSSVIGRLDRDKSVVDLLKDFGFYVYTENGAEFDHSRANALNALLEGLVRIIACDIKGLPDAVGAYLEAAGVGAEQENKYH